MPDLRVQTAKNNGDLQKDPGQSVKDITLKQETNPAVIKAYYEQFKKEFGRPSLFEKGQRSRK